MLTIDHNKSPKEKAGKEWLIECAKKAYNDHKDNVPDMFYGSATEYARIKSYVLGRQDTSPYKKEWIDPEQPETKQTFANIDFEALRPIASKYRDKVVSMLLQRDFNMICTPIDALAKDDADKYFADIRVKILMRDVFKKANSELAESPVLMPEPGEPQDMEELEMQMNYTWKHQMAIEAQNLWRLIAYQNEFKEERKITIENLYDYGVGGYKEFIENGRVKVRAIMPGNIITGYCRFADFRDAHCIGEVIEVSKSDLENYFSKEDIADMEQGDTTHMRQTGVFGKKKNSVEVLDLEIITFDDWVYEQRESSVGNLRFGRSEYANRTKTDSKVIIDGKEEPRYIVKKPKEIYRIKWVIGTKYAYEYGLDKNKKRELGNPLETSSQYHIYAYNFNEMRCLSMMKRLIPIIDEYQMTHYKIQNFKNRWIPYIIKIDLDALESVALGKGSENMTPRQLLAMMWQTNVLVGRSSAMGGNNPNYKSVEVLATNMAQEFSVLVADLVRLLQDMADISGLNDLTDGSTPNPKILTTPAQMGYEATKNAIFPLLDADRKLHERTAKGAIQRGQTAIRSGQTIQGVAPSLGGNSVKFIKVSKDIALHDIGIMCRDMPTETQKMQLLERLNMKDAQGLVDPEDYVMIMNIDDLKQAEQLLAFKVKKRREKQQQDAIAMQRENGQIQIQSAQAAEKAKQETAAMMHQFKMQEIEAEKQWDLKIAQVKAEAQTADSQTNAGAKIAGHAIQQYGKEREKKIDQGIPVEDDDQGMMQQLQQAQAPQQEEVDPAMQEQMMAEQMAGQAT